jgi:hypothetical protein
MTEYKLPLIRRRTWPGAPWGEWYTPASIDEFDEVLMEEYNWGKLKCAEHQQVNDTKQ